LKDIRKNVGTKRQGNREIVAIVSGGGVGAEGMEVDLASDRHLGTNIKHL